jgi:hypothetical protein
MLVEQVILAHLDYLNQIVDFVEGRKPEAQTRSHTECTLGRWLAGEGQEHREAPWFDELFERHRRFHEVTQAAVQLTQEGRGAEAQEKVNEAYQLFSWIESTLLNL